MPHVQGISPIQLPCTKAAPMHPRGKALRRSLWSPPHRRMQHTPRRFCCIRTRKLDRICLSVCLCNKKEVEVMTVSSGFTQICSFHCFHSKLATLLSEINLTVVATLWKDRRHLVLFKYLGHSLNQQSNTRVTAIQFQGKETNIPLTWRGLLTVPPKASCSPIPNGTVMLVLGSWLGFGP